MSLLTPFKDVTPTLNNLAPFYYGTVEDNNDPLGLQRIKVRIKELFGNIETSNLPWCIKDDCAGNSNSSGIICTPSVGQVVKVSFDCGDIYSPKYSNGFINQVPDALSGSDVFGIIDKLSNYIKFDGNGITISDKNGNSIMMDSNGITLNGNSLIKLNSTTTDVTGDMIAEKKVTATDEVEGKGVHLSTHTHKYNPGPGSPTDSDSPTAGS